MIPRKRENMISTTSSEFLNWLNGCQSIINSYYKTNYANISSPVLKFDEGSKCIRVFLESGGTRSCYCFVAKVNYETKELGQVKEGDILKSASWKKPAKHARGNLFDKDNGLQWMNSYGATYLR